MSSGDRCSMHSVEQVVVFGAGGMLSHAAGELCQRNGTSVRAVIRTRSSFAPPPPKPFSSTCGSPPGLCTSPQATSPPQLGFW